MKRCRIAKQVLSQMVKKKHTKGIVEKAYLAVTQLIKNINGSKIKEIFGPIDRLYNAALNPSTVRRPIRLGLENVPPRMGNGRKPLLLDAIEAALVNVIFSFVGLACAEQKKTPNRKSLINVLSSCLEEGPTP